MGHGCAISVALDDQIDNVTPAADDEDAAAVRAAGVAGAGASVAAMPQRLGTT